MNSRWVALAALLVASACSSSHHAAPSPSTRAPAGTTTTTATGSEPTTTTTSAAPSPPPPRLRPFSATFVSPTTAFVLGGGRCNNRRVCAARLLRTDDRGRTWTPVPTPSVTAGDEGGGTLVGVRFANTRDGYLYGRGLLSTHDGGAHWNRVPLAGCGTIEGLEIGTGITHVVAECRKGFGLFTGPFTRDAFRAAPVALPYGAGPIPQIQLVVRGARGWLVDLDRGLIAAAEYDHGSWHPWPSAPCRTEIGNGFPDLLVGFSGAYMIASCEEFAGRPGVTFVASNDGGATFHALGTDVAHHPPAPAVVLDAHVWFGSDGTHMLRTADAGHTWQIVAPFDPNGDVEFTAATQAFTIPFVAPGDTRLMYLTTDAGRTWHAVSFD